MKRRVATILACAMAALPLSSASPLGGVAVSGVVWTNQTALPSGSNVYAGDHLRTAPDALAVLQSPAVGRVELRGDSQARFGERTIALESGVVASQRLAVELDDLAIAPSDPQADNWFVVENRPKRSLVAVYRGQVVIRGGSVGWIEVPAGAYAMAVPESKPEQPASGARQDADATTPGETDSKDKRPAGGAAGAGAKTGWSIGSLSHTASVVVVTGATAAVLAGVAVAEALDEDSPSPQN